MVNVISPTLLARYLAELREDERKVNKAADAYETAKASLDVNLRRYIALRDFITEQAGESPYAAGVNWPENTDGWDSPVLGRFRFTGMRTGDAILQLLRDESNGPDFQDREGNVRMTLSEIVTALSIGGLGFPDQVQARAVNAALLRPPHGIVREDAPGGTARYYYVEPPEEPDNAATVSLAAALKTVMKKGGDRFEDPDDLPFE